MKDNVHVVEFLGTNYYTGGDPNRDFYIRNPSGYGIQENDLDKDTKRGTDGTLHRNVIAVNKNSISLHWDRISRAELDRLRIATYPKNGYAIKYYWSQLNYETGQVISPYTTFDKVYTSGSRSATVDKIYDEEEAYYSYDLELIYM